MSNKSRQVIGWRLLNSAFDVEGSQPAEWEPYMKDQRERRLQSTSYYIFAITGTIDEQEIRRHRQYDEFGIRGNVVVIDSTHLCSLPNGRQSIGGWQAVIDSARHSFNGKLDWLNAEWKSTYRIYKENEVTSASFCITKVYNKYVKTNKNVKTCWTIHEIISRKSGNTNGVCIIIVCSVQAGLTVFSNL